MENMMNKMREKVANIKGRINNQRGDIFQFIIILAVVAIIAVVSIPGINSKITGKANDAINKIDNLDPSAGSN